MKRLNRLRGYVHAVYHLLGQVLYFDRYRKGSMQNHTLIQIYWTQSMEKYCLCLSHYFNDKMSFVASLV